jgi:integration host factor subunit beta
MNKSDLTKALSKDMDLPVRKAEEIVDKVFDTMTKSLVSGDRIEVRGFGSFTVREYDGYTGRNPKTGETTVVVAKRLPFFKVGQDLKDRLNKH